MKKMNFLELNSVKGGLNCLSVVKTTINTSKGLVTACEEEFGVSLFKKPSVKTSTGLVTACEEEFGFAPKVSPNAK